ncbi:MAG: 4-(cytidine 5'-diphospho)-2-C-methyl-D-erythritol kinase [Phycisphaerales bacterium]|nr:4-(cytidine 5'-diphospho)-2-C-methyl-D-erythritol kinase [Phycisphaerales bacterium]
MSRALSIRASAKINLALRVFPPRADGFHPIDSLTATIGLFDELRIERRPDDLLHLTCDDPTLPTDGRNLVLRAAGALRAALRDNAGSRPAPAPLAAVGFNIHLTKRIPAGAGLGGGSSDAAATLRAANSLLGNPLSNRQLQTVAAALGSDVALFLHRAVSRIRGRGEIVTPVRDDWPAWIALILPPLHCATPAVYRAFDELPPPPERPSIESVISAIENPDALMTLLFNDLERAASQVCPPLGALAAQIQDATGAALCMSGSGAAYFRVFGTERPAREFAERVTRAAAVRCDVVPAAPPEPAAE